MVAQATLTRKLKQWRCYMEIEDWLPFEVDTTKAAAIARLEIERYQRDIKRAMTSGLEDAAMYYGVMAGIAYANVEHDLAVGDAKEPDEYVAFLENILGLSIETPRENITLN